MKKPKLKKYPIGGTKGFIPDTMVHYIGAGEVPYSKDQLSSMGYNYETSTGGFDEYSMGNNRRFYKTISPGTPEWNNPENPYLNAVASTQPVVKPAPKLKWPTRTDYSKGSKGPIYDVPTFGDGGKKGKVTPYVTNDPNDPRILAYTDSLDAYKWSKKALDTVLKTKKSPQGSDVDINNYEIKTRSQRFNEYKEDNKKWGLKLSDKDINTELNRLDPINKGTGKLNKATHYYTFPTKNSSSFISLAQYAKPKQEVIYEPKKQEVIQPTNTKVTNTEPVKKGPSKYTTKDKTGKQYYFVNEKPVTENEYNNYYKNIPTFSHGGMKLPKYFNGGTESSSMIEDYRAEDGSNFWDGANGQESYYKSQEPVAPAAYGQQNNSGYKPNYNAMIGNSAMATANYANVYQDPDATTSDKAAAARQGAAQIAGSINPMIGSIIGGVDAIAQPIKNNAEQMNSKGQLTNRNKARAGAIAGNILSPSTLATTIASGKWDLKGDKYLNELESNAQAQIAAEQAPMLAAAEAKRNMYYTYAQGGVHSGMPNAELENREMYNIPGGPISEVNGPSHEQGGVPVSIPNGTEMLPDNSDSLKINAKIVKMFPNLFSKKDIGKTFSDTSRNLKTTKEDKIMKDDKASNLSKSTASLNIAVKKAKYQQKMKALEEFKKSKLQDYAKKLGVTLAQEGMQEVMQSPFTGEGMEEGMQYSTGGTKLPKYYEGGGIGYVDPENLRLAQQAQSGFPAMEQVEDPSFNNALFNKYQTPFIKPSEAERLNKERANLKQPYVPNPNDPYEQAMAAGKEFDTPSSNTPNRKMNPDWIEPATNALMQNMGNLMYLKDQGKKYDKQEFYKYSPELYNPADALRQADIEARVNRGRLKDATGGNAGALMSNLTQSQAINTLLKSKIRNDAFNQNANTLNDAQVRNIQGKYNVDDINARNKGQALTNYYKAIQGIGMNTTAAYTDWKRGNMDKNTAGMLSTMFSNYGLDINNPNDWKIFYKKASNKE